MEGEQKPYPYEREEYSIEELQLMKTKASCRGFNVFQDYNHVIYNLTCQLMEEKVKNEKGN